MSDSEAGPSGMGKLKYDFRPHQPLSMKQLERLANELGDSESTDLEGSNSDDDFILEVSCSSESDVENYTNNTNTGPSNITAGAGDNIWTDNYSSVQQMVFTKAQELLVQPRGNQPIDFFFLLVGDEILNLIVEQANIYAAEILCLEDKTEGSRISLWKPLTVAELKIFIGLLFVTGTINLSRIQDYWKKDSLFNIQCFSQHMSRNRFLLILRCLHFAENPEKEAGAVPQDRLHKIRPIIDYFNEKMTSVFYPGKELSLDESMVLWRGRLVFRQYIKNKRHKYGIKLYMLTTPKGIVLKSIVYTGQLDDLGGKGHAENVVFNLISEILDSGHSLYMDNFYNSVDLTKKLLDRKTHCTGTLRIDRKNNPKDVKDTKLKKDRVGETVAKYCNGDMVGKWKDKRDVYYISNEYTNKMIDVETKRGEVKTKPKPIAMYNKFMSGIDRQDQMLAYYPCERKTTRWYTKICIHFLQMSLTNVLHLHNMYSGHKIILYNFRLSVIQPLLKKSDTAPNTTPQKKEHVMRKCGKSKNETTLRRVCKSCTAKGIKRRETVYECPDCPDIPGFCLDCCHIIHK